MHAVFKAKNAALLPVRRCQAFIKKSAIQGMHLDQTGVNVISHILPVNEISSVVHFRDKSTIISL
jgi:hypothetical protein